MAHTCPECGQSCHCQFDIDDIIFGDRWDCICCMNKEEDSDDWEDVDDELDEEVEEVFNESKYTKDGGIVDPENPNTIHYPSNPFHCKVCGDIVPLDSEYCGGDKCKTINK